MTAPALLHRLVLGVVLLDAAGGGAARPATGSRVGVEPLRPSTDLLRWTLDGTAPLEGHGEGRAAALQGIRTPRTVTLRVGDDAGRWVPRRVVVTLRPAGENVAVALRTARLKLYPGPAYRLAGGTTALRLRVVRPALPGAPAGAEPVPVPWPRVDVFDDRGSFLTFAHGDGAGQVLAVVPALAGDPRPGETRAVVIRVHAAPRVRNDRRPVGPWRLPVRDDDPLALLPADLLDLTRSDPDPAGALEAGTAPLPGYTRSPDVVRALTVARVVAVDVPIT